MPILEPDKCHNLENNMITGGCNEHEDVYGPDRDEIVDALDDGGDEIDVELNLFELSLMIELFDDSDFAQDTPGDILIKKLKTKYEDLIDKKGEEMINED